MGRRNDANQPPVKRWWSRALLLMVVAAGLHIAVLARETGRMGGQDGLGTLRLPDEGNYYIHCADLAAEHGWAFLKSEDSLRSGPLVWMWLLLWGRNVAACRLANIALVLIGSLLVSLVARRRFGDRKALLAFFLCACGFQIVLFSGTVLSEPLAFFFVCLWLWAIHRAMLGGRMGFIVLAGVSCGLAALARPALLLLPAALIGAWGLARLLRLRLDGQCRAVLSWRRLAVLLVCHVVLVAPWMAKNLHYLGVARLANGFGAVLYLGSDLRLDGNEPVFSGMQWPTNQITGPYSHMQIEGDRRLAEAAVSNIRRHPLAWARLGLVKVGRTLIGGPDWHFFPGDHYGSKRNIEGRGPTTIVFLWWTVAGTVVTVFGLAGLGLMWRGQQGLAVAGLVLVAYLVTLHSITYALPRFAVPFYPALVLGLCGYFARRRSRVLTVLLIVVSAAIPSYLALYHRYRPRCIVAPDKLEYFTIDQHWEVTGDGPGPIVLEAGGLLAAFNSCIFVEAAVDQGPGQGNFFGTLQLREQGANSFNESAGIGFRVIADGRRRTYRICVELQEAWRAKRWDAVKWTITPAGTTIVGDARITLAH